MAPLIETKTRTLTGTVVKGHRPKARMLTCTDHLGTFTWESLLLSGLPVGATATIQFTETTTWVDGIRREGSCETTTIAGIAHWSPPTI